MTKIATYYAKTLVNDGGLNTGRGRAGNKQLTNMATVDAKQGVNEGGLRKGKGGVGGEHTDPNGHER